jgi:hypothetical protein
MAESYRVAPDIHVLSTSFAVPGLGQLPINAFVLEACTCTTRARASTSAIASSSP